MIVVYLRSTSPTITYIRSLLSRLREQPTPHDLQTLTSARKDTLNVRPKTLSGVILLRPKIRLYVPHLMRRALVKDGGEEALRSSRPFFVLMHDTIIYSALFFSERGGRFSLSEAVCAGKGSLSLSSSHTLHLLSSIPLENGPKRFFSLRDSL